MHEYIEEFGLFIIYSIAGFFASLTGGNDLLLVMVQWMFLLDFLIGLVSSAKAGVFSWYRAYKGFKKIASLYFSLIIVGLGIQATAAIVTTPVFGYSPSFIFDAFVFFLVLFELQSINRHLARWGLQVNKMLDVFLTKLVSALFSKAITTIEDIGDNDREDIDETLEELNSSNDKKEL